MSSNTSTLISSLRAKADDLSTLHSAAQADEPDAVHQMRVAARTLRANLRTFADALPDSGDLPDELSWLGDTLAPAREAEVLSELVLDLLARTPDDLVIGPVRSRIREVFDMEHDAAMTGVREALASERYHTLITDLDSYLESAGSPKHTADHSAKHDLSSLHRKVRRRMRAALPLPPGPDRDEAMHEARKAARRARYAAEALGRSSKPIKALQDVLGEEHDRVVTAVALTDLAASAHLDGENAFTYGVLIGLVRCDSKGFDKRVRRAWRTTRKAL